MYFQGFLKVENFFSPEELQPVREEIEEMVEDLAQRLVKAGKIKSEIFRRYLVQNCCELFAKNINTYLLDCDTTIFSHNYILYFRPIQRVWIVPEINNDQKRVSWSQCCLAQTEEGSKGTTYSTICS